MKHWVNISTENWLETIDGKDIQISKEEFENIKAQFCK